MKVHLGIVLALAGILCAALPASAQRTISGNVKDTEGYDVIGAGVVQEGTNNGVVTDLDGNFVLTVPEGAEITVSSIGYKPMTFTVDSRTMYSSAKSSGHENSGRSRVLSFVLFMLFVSLVLFTSFMPLGFLQWMSSCKRPVAVMCPGWAWKRGECDRSPGNC